MQAIELETQIQKDGRICLPDDYKNWFGKQIKLILLDTHESIRQEYEAKQTILNQAWGCVDNPKSITQIDNDIAQMRGGINNA